MELMIDLTIIDAGRGMYGLTGMAWTKSEPPLP